MGIRYRGEFVGADGSVWRAEILQRDYTGTIGELEFPYNEPLTIAWEEREKENPIQGSIATLKIESPGDRTYINLYTVEAGYISLRVYRDNKLYWSGCLDPEFYEEPYDQADKYDVTLTFTDFGILDRIKWESTDFWTLDNIVSEAIKHAGIESAGGVTGQYTLKCSTGLDSSMVPLRLSQLSVIGTNFFDEDDEPRTWLEVLEAVLQPLALRIIQRGGTVFVYDINSLAVGATNGAIEWDGEGSMLSSDRVVNSCKVTFSPYNKTDIYDGSLDADDVRTTGASAVEYGVEDFKGEQIPGFRLLTGDKGKTKLPYTIVNGTLTKVESVFSGNDEAMVLIARRGNVESNHGTAVMDKFYSAYPYNRFSLATDAVDAIVTKPAFLRNSSNNFKLKITVEALIDVRYNPYESAGEHNEEGSWSRLQNWSNFGYIPASLYLKDADGNILYHYDNRRMIMKSSTAISNKLPFTPNTSYEANIKGWTKGAPSRPDTYMLCWYSNSDRKSSSGFGGWQTNRQCIGYFRKNLPALYDKRGEGDFIDLPPVAGYLELHVMDRVWQFDYGCEEKDIYQYLRWVAIKNPCIQLVDKWGKDIDEKDVEYTGWINRWASEEMSISTEVGTLDEAMPTARGALLRTDNHNQVQKLYRAGVCDCAERLLIGTVYSQYSTRHTKLSGECVIVPSGLPVLTEQNQPMGTKFILAGETQDCRAAVSESVWVEALPDNWEGLKFED